LAYFSGEQNFSTTDISHTLCQSATKFGSIRDLTIKKYSPNFVNFGLGGLVISCGDMQKSFTYTCKVVFLNIFPIFADSFNVLLFTALPED